MALTAAIEPRAIDLNAGWGQIETMAARPRRDWRLVPAFLASIALGALLVTWFSGPKVVSASQVVVAQGVEWHMQGDELVLRRGQLTLSSASSQKLTTPHLSLELLHGRVAAEVSDERTGIVVEEGAVVVRSAGIEHRLNAGDHFSWPMSAGISAEVLAPAAESPACQQLAGPTQLKCLELEAGGVGLAAQAALYELGWLHAHSDRPGEAIATWQQSLRRFPDGLMHPEVRFALVLELARQHRFAEADRAAAAFEALCPQDPRRVDVARLRASIAARR